MGNIYFRWDVNMVKIEESVMIDRPVEEVWKFVTDLSKLPKYQTAVVEAKQTSAGPIGVGSTFEIRRKDNTTTPQRCIEYEPNRKFSMEVTSGPVKGTIFIYSVETVEGKTRFTSTGDMKYNGLYKLLGPFLSSSMRKEDIAAVGNVKRILESEAKS
jgi:uncharacterized protein YndB with AHSA1/START domain